MTLIDRLRNRVNDSPMPAEHLMDEAATALETMLEALEEIAFADVGGYQGSAWMGRRARAAIAKVKEVSSPV